MSIAIDITHLVAYSDHERAKWKAWVAADPARLAIPFQNGGRFPTLGSLFDHIFLIEARHLSRLKGGPLPESSGVTPGDWPALFAYAHTVRANLISFVAALNEQAANESLTFKIASGPLTLTRRRLTLHILLHEVRHLAQIAYAARAAGLEPPGEHDVAFFPGF